MTRTEIRCDACGVVIVDGQSCFYLTTKRTAPSVDAHLCGAACGGQLAARLQRPAYTPNGAPWPVD